MEELKTRKAGSWGTRQDRGSAGRGGGECGRVLLVAGWVAIQVPDGIKAYLE